MGDEEKSANTDCDGSHESLEDVNSHVVPGAEADGDEAPKGGDDRSSAQGATARIVQVQADNTEITRRIRAFFDKKRAENDQNNIREFCHRMKEELDDERCARTDAVFLSRVNGRARHINLSRVHNVQGPQTASVCKVEPFLESDMLGQPGGATRHAAGGDTCSHHRGNRLPEGIEERLQNMEEHLQLRVKPVPSCVYQRLQRLEEKILHLESLSPEYFNGEVPSVKRRKLQHSAHLWGITPKIEPINSQFYEGTQDLKIGEIDARISQLKKILHHGGQPSGYDT